MDKQAFERLTIDEVTQRAATAPTERSPGVGKEIPSAWQTLLDEMMAESAQTVGGLSAARVDFHRFTTKSHYGSVTEALLGTEISPDED